MTERWQRELARLKDAELPGGLWERATEGPRMEPPRVPVFARASAAVAGLAVFVAGALLAWSAFAGSSAPVRPLGGPGTYDVPPLGEVAPVFLPDGRPVFIVHHEDDTVSVVDALSTHTPWGITDLNAWCPSTREFVEVAHEARFDELGRWVSAGPAPTGVATFAFDVLERDAAGAPASIRVGEMREPDPHGSGTTAPERPPLCPPAEASGSRPLIDVIGGASGNPGTVLAHHVSEDRIWGSPATAVAAEPEGWIAVRGTLLVARDDGFVQLCARVAGRRPDGIGYGVTDERRCEDGAIVRGVQGVELLVNVIGPNPDTAYEEPAIWLARAREGVLDDLVGAFFIEPR
ncbi:MAG TPA: hypothetical protein VGB51_07855 [Actinomycetota bacterium]